MTWSLENRRRRCLWVWASRSESAPVERRPGRPRPTVPPKFAPIKIGGRLNLINGDQWRDSEGILRPCLFTAAIWLRAERSSVRPAHIRPSAFFDASKVSIRANRALIDGASIEG
jgi:hypothetical protein